MWTNPKSFHGEWVSMGAKTDLVHIFRNLGFKKYNNKIFDNFLFICSHIIISTLNKFG